MIKLTFVIHLLLCLIFVQHLSYLLLFQKNIKFNVLSYFAFQKQVQLVQDNHLPYCRLCHQRNWEWDHSVHVKPLLDLYFFNCCKQSPEENKRQTIYLEVFQLKVVAISLLQKTCKWGLQIHNTPNGNMSYSQKVHVLQKKF